MEKNGKVDALDLGRIKNVVDLVIKPNGVLIEVKEVNKSGLILPEHAKRENTIWEIVKVGRNVMDYSVGQYVINADISSVEFMFKGDSKFILIDYYNLLLVCNPDNYEQPA